MKNLLRNAGLMAVAAFAVTAAVAVAGEDAKPGEKVERRVVVVGGPGGGDHPGGPMKWRGRSKEDRAEHLRTILQLRPDQEAALQAFLTATEPQRIERKVELKPGEKPKMLTTPERLDRQAKMMADRQAAFAKRSAATKAFYAALTPAQQKVFDSLHRGMRGMGGPGERRVFRMRRPGGPGHPGGPDHPGGPGGMAFVDGDVDELALLEGGLEGDVDFVIELEGPEGDEQ